MKLPDVALPYGCTLSDTLQWWETLLNLQFPPKSTGVSTSHQEQLNANTLHTALCNYLDVWMEVHERPLAVFTVDPQGKLHLFVQHNKNSHSLLLSEIKENTWNAGTSMDSVCFHREEKLEAVNVLCLLMEMLIEVICSWLCSSRSSMGTPQPGRTLGKLSSFLRRAQYLGLCGFCCFVWAMPRPIHRSFLQQLLLHTLWGRFCKHDSLQSCSSTKVQCSAGSCCPEGCPQLNVPAGWHDHWGYTDIPILKGMSPTQHQ